MSSTRDFKSLGVIASDALEVTEDGVRDQGVAYRRTNISDVVQIEGEPFDEPPITENINQKLFNQSSFTDIVDRSAVPGWVDLVDYSPPAFVYASDGKYYYCLRDSGPSTDIFDPIDDDQADPVFWELAENANKLRKDLATSTPGAEGARIVGYNNIGNNGGLADPTTVKDALDSAFNGLFFNGSFKVLGTGKLFVIVDNSPLFPLPPVVLNTDVDSNFNTSMGDPVPIITSVPNFFGESQLQGFTVSFENPITTPYNIQAALFSRFVLPVGTALLAISARNLTTTSFDIYMREGPNIGDISSRVEWLFNYIAYSV